MSDPRPFADDSADTLAALADASDAWVCRLDADGRVTWAAARHAPHGLAPGSAIGQPWPALLGLGDTARAAVLAALRQREPLDHEDPIDGPHAREPVPGDDAPLPPAWRIALRPLPDGGWWATARDLSPMQRLQAQLAHQHAVLETVRRLTRVGIWERDVATGRGRWDDTVFRLFGFDADGGTPDFDEAVERVHPDDRLASSYRDSLARTGDYQARYRVRLPDGAERMVRSQWCVVPGADGRPQRVIGVMSDETEIEGLSRSFGLASEQLQLAVSVSGVGLWVHDLATDRMHYNDALYTSTGMRPRPEGITLDEVRSLIHPDDVATVVASAARALASDQPVDFEARYRHADGGWRSVLSRRAVQRDANGRPIAFLGVSLDVTEQLRSRELAQRLNAAVLAAGVGLWQRDLGTGEVEWNEPMLRIFGLTPGGRPPSLDAYLDRVHPDDRPRVQEAVRHLQSAPAGTVVDLAYRIVRPDGEVRWLEQRTGASLRDGHRLLSGVTMDVSDRMRAEQELRWTTDRGVLAARSAGMGTWSLDLGTGVAQWDEQMYRLRGLAPRRGPAPSHAERIALVHPDDRHAFPADADASTDIDQTSREFRIVRPDGSVRWLASRSRLVRGPDGVPSMRVGVNWDITDAKAADQVREEREAALRANRAKSEFLARMSHELRTPLNAVLGFSLLLRDELAAAPPAQRMKLDHIRDAGEHLLSLINDVLELTRLETGTVRLDVQPVELSTLLGQVRPLADDLARRHEVTLDLPARTAAPLLADPMRLRQVLVNLITNGIKYNRPGGQVRVRLQAVGDRALVTVEDDGHGMSEEQLAHLFEPFNRLGAQARGIEGTGIGLVIVKALCEAMGGAVRVSSRPGAGTTVALDLPVVATAVAAMPPAPRPATVADTRPRPGPGTVLYIEDNAVNVLLVRELLASQTDLVLSVAEDGASGVALAAQTRPDLVLVDMQLPDMDGHEVLARLRADPSTRGLPCIALSANAMQDDIRRALDAGFVDYWTKPIDFATFLQALARRFPAAAAAPLPA